MSALGGSHQLEWGDIGIEMGGGGGRRDRTGMWLQGGTMCVPTDERREKISMRVVHALKKKLSQWVGGIKLGRPPGVATTSPRPLSGRKDIPGTKTSWLKDLRSSSKKRHEDFQEQKWPTSLPGKMYTSAPPRSPRDAGRRRSLSGLMLPYLFPDALPSRCCWSAHCTSSTSNLLQNCAYLTLCTAPTLVAVPSSLARQIVPKHKSDTDAPSPASSLLPIPAPLCLLTPEKPSSSTFRTCTCHLPVPRRQSTSLKPLSFELTTLTFR